MIARVDSPTNFFAKDGTPATFCSWSTTTRVVAPSVPTVVVQERASLASPTRSQKSGSLIMASTSAGGASYASSWRNLMGDIMPARLACMSASSERTSESSGEPSSDVRFGEQGALLTYGSYLHLDRLVGFPQLESHPAPPHGPLFNQN